MNAARPKLSSLSKLTGVRWARFLIKQESAFRAESRRADGNRKCQKRGRMYHAIVKRIARKNFERVNQKNFDALLQDCVPDVRHRFYGSHALSGERHDREAVRRWFERLGRLGLTLTVQDVWVKGLPHDTTIILRWTAKDTLINGSPYSNYGVHVLKMRWFKIVDIDAYEDSQAVAENLKLQAAHGIREAAEPPIIS